MRLVVTINGKREFELDEEEAEAFRQCPEDEKHLFLDYYISKTHDNVEVEWEVID